MENPEVTNRDRIIYALIAVILGGSGAAGVRAIDPPRPDPWTGTEARAAHKEIRDDLHQHIVLVESELAEFKILATHNFTLRDQMYQDLERLKKQVYGH